MRHLLLPITLLFALTAPAFATVSIQHRQPVSASIPCPGQLDEDYTEGGNMHGGFFSMSLTCRKGSHVFWILEGGQGCNSEDIPEDGKDICGPEAGVINGFRTGNEKKHVYAMLKYVFATDCEKAQMLEKRMTAETNKVRSSISKSGFMCRQVSLVDGTTDDSFTSLPLDRLRSGHVTTFGEPESMTNEQQQPIIFGVDQKDSGAYWRRDKSGTHRETD